MPYSPRLLPSRPFSIYIFPGKYSNSSPSRGYLDCNVGYYSSYGYGSCFPCPSGTYASSVRTSVCTQCISGKYSSLTGASNSSVCLDCPMGFYSNNGASTCLSCQEGSYSNTPVHAPLVRTARGLGWARTPPLHVSPLTVWHLDM